jgi:hypothetical protein
MSPHEDVDRLEDWVAETPASISARLEGAKIAQSQIRFTLGTMAVISVMMLIASYNAYLSYDYFWIIDKCPPLISAKEAAAYAAAKPSPDPEAATTAPDQTTAKAAPDQIANHQAATDQVTTIQAAPDISKTLQDQAYKDWAASRTGLISLLGIRVSVDDAAVLGTAVLLVLSIWLLLVTRRENHTIGFLLRDTDDQASDDNPKPMVAGATESLAQVNRATESWRIYQTIISNSLFVIFSHWPKVSSLTRQNSWTAIAAADENDDRGWLTRILLGFARSFFFWFPVFASLIMFGLDRSSYFRPDHFSTR